MNVDKSLLLALWAVLGNRNEIQHRHCVGFFHVSLDDSTACTVMAPIYSLKDITGLQQSVEMFYIFTAEYAFQNAQVFSFF